MCFLLLLPPQWVNLHVVFSRVLVGLAGAALLQSAHFPASLSLVYIFAYFTLSFVRSLPHCCDAWCILLLVVDGVVVLQLPDLVLGVGRMI